MPKYQLRGNGFPRGKETKGTLEVASQNEAITRVKEMGLFPTKIVEVDKVREKSEKKGKTAGKSAGKPPGQEGRRDEHQHQDSRPERQGENRRC